MIWFSDTPDYGDVVQCYFPYPHTNRNQRHPALVLDWALDKSGNRYLYVAGGTSLQTGNFDYKHIAQHDFPINKTETAFKKTGLDKSTKFQLNFKNTLYLPYNDDYFCVISPNQTSVSGSIDFNNAPMLDRLKLIANHVDLEGNAALRLKEIP